MANPVFEAQKRFFADGTTLPAAFRLDQLARLKKAIESRDDAILKAIQRDTGRPATEIFASELFTVYKEISFARKHLKRWMRPERVATPWMLLPGKSYIHKEPYGVVLVLAPWNYPFQLVLVPLIGAIAAGNCAIIKPSECAPHTLAIVTEIMEKTFGAEYIHTVQGGPDIAQDLLGLDFDYIFFTGSPGIGRDVMTRAAKTLTPVTLELGGKCPGIVTADCHLESAARRLAWGKYFNAGQTCLAPDYVLAETSIKQDLIAALKRNIRAFYGDDPARSPDYGRIINPKHFDRIMNLLDHNEPSRVAADRERLYIPPTIIENPRENAGYMIQEIFGPILPVLEYQTLDDALAYVNQRPKPLALYVFSSSGKTRETVIERTRSGSVTINDVLIQAVSCRLPFGGVGSSGMGRYRGKHSFTTFSNSKSILQRRGSPDWAFRYPPYTRSLETLRKILKRL